MVTVRCECAVNAMFIIHMHCVLHTTLLEIKKKKVKI